MGSGRIAASRSETFLGQAIAQLSDDLRRWLYVLALLCLISLLAFLYLTRASHVARQIEEMRGCESQLRELRRANSAILLQIAQCEQLPRIQQAARDLGLGEPQHIEYVEVVLDQPAPLFGDEMAREPPLSSPVDSSHLSGWWQKALCQFADWILGSVARAEPPGG